MHRVVWLKFYDKISASIIKNSTALLFVEYEDRVANFEVLRLTGGKRSVRYFPLKALDPGLKVLPKVQHKKIPK